MIEACSSGAKWCTINSIQVWRLSRALRCLEWLLTGPFLDAFRIALWIFDVLENGLFGVHGTEP